MEKALLHIHKILYLDELFHVIEKWYSKFTFIQIRNP